MAHRLLPLFAFLALLGGASAAPLPHRTLVVAVEESSPFLLRDGDGWAGISVDLWKKVAADLNLSYRFVEVPAGTSLSRLAIGQADVALRPYALTEENEEVADFSDVYFHTGLALEVYRHARSPWAIVREDVLSWPILGIVGVMALTLAASGCLIWLLERDKNAGQFGGHGLHGFGSGMWWASATMTTVGYGDKIPRTFPGRFVAIFLMFASLVITSVFTAAVTSVATVKSFQQPAPDVRNLGGLRLAAVAGSVAEEYAVRNRLQVVPCADLAAAERALRDGRADAFLQNEPALRYERHRQAGTPSQAQARDGFTILPQLVAPADFAFAFPDGSPLRETVNRALLHALQGPAWADIQYAYLGN